MKTLTQSSQSQDKRKNTPALVHYLLKKKDVVDYVGHEVSLLNVGLSTTVSKFASLVALVQNFTASGANGVVTAFLKGGPNAQNGIDNALAVKVAEYRDQDVHDVKTQALIDFLWSLWNGVFDDEIEELCVADLQSNGPVSLWHCYFKESPKAMSVKYRAFVEACMAGPIPLASNGQDFLGTTELSEADKEDLQKVQELLKALRRKSVSFTTLPTLGGASGAHYTKAQLEKVWESMRLGHAFNKKKTTIRAFVFSADMFPPNMVKHGTTTSLSEPIAVDAERMKRTIEFILQKRTKDDIVLLFDGRSKLCRRVMENYEERLAGSGSHSLSEYWIVYTLPTKYEDPRIPGRQSNFHALNKEVVMCALPSNYRTVAKIVQRAEFNLCGEISTASTTYTGVPVRRYCELPRMTTETKASILGSAASGAMTGKRVQKNIEAKGHPFSHCEVKPLNLWQRICEHHHVTHIVDFTPGSAALAIAASGAMEYDGIAANQVHQEWLDMTVDRCIMYMVGKDKQLVKKFGGDDLLMDKVSKYFAGTMMEARRLLEPPQAAKPRAAKAENDAEDGSSDSEDESDEDGSAS